MWEGCPHLTDWHQSLDAETSKAALKGAAPFEGCVLELNDGSAKKLCVVSAYDHNSGCHELTLANGVHIQIELHTCTLASGDKVAWKLVQRDLTAVPLTDAVVNWTATPELKACKIDWADGSCFPSFDASRTVLLQLQEQNVFTMESTPAQCEGLAKLCAWLQTSLARELVTGRFESEKLQPSFLQGSLIHDSLRVITSVDESILSKWKRNLKQKTTVDSLL